MVNPTIAWRVESEASGSAEQLGSGRALSPYTGRDRERTMLDHAWQLATSGDTQFVLLRGEPGMGKSRLAKLYRDRADVSGGRLLVRENTVVTSVPVLIE